jgi:hypothetical protein
MGGSIAEPAARSSVIGSRETVVWQTGCSVKCVTSVSSEADSAVLIPCGWNGPGQPDLHTSAGGNNSKWTMFSI